MGKEKFNMLETAYGAKHSDHFIFTISITNHILHVFTFINLVNLYFYYLFYFHRGWLFPSMNTSCSSIHRLQNLCFK